MIVYLDQNMAGKPIRDALQSIDQTIEIRSIADEGWSTKADHELAGLASARGGKALVTMDSRIKGNPQALAEFAGSIVLVCFDHRFTIDPPGIVAAVANAWPAVMAMLRASEVGTILTIKPNKGIVHIHHSVSGGENAKRLLSQVGTFEIPSVPKPK